MSGPDSGQDQGGMLPWVQRKRLKGRCLPLLVSLVALLALYPYLERDGDPTTLVRVLFSLIPLAGVYAVSSKRWHVPVAAILALPFLGFQWLPVAVGKTSAEPYLMAGVVAFYCFTTLTILAHVLRGSTISDDVLYGAISVYLLLGFAFAAAYMLMESAHPGTFAVGSDHDPDSVMSWSDLLYFSFVTLTTLGYGDMAPVTSQARSLCLLEAVVGPLYIAVLIARLVGSASWGSGSRER